MGAALVRAVVAAGLMWTTPALAQAASDTPPPDPAPEADAPPAEDPAASAAARGALDIVLGSHRAIAGVAGGDGESIFARRPRATPLGPDTTLHRVEVPSVLIPFVADDGMIAAYLRCAPESWVAAAREGGPGSAHTDSDLACDVGIFDAAPEASRVTVRGRALAITRAADGGMSVSLTAQGAAVAGRGFEGPWSQDTGPIEASFRTAGVGDGRTEVAVAAEIAQFSSSDRQGPGLTIDRISYAARLKATDLDLLTKALALVFEPVRDTAGGSQAMPAPDLADLAAKVAGAGESVAVDGMEMLLLGGGRLRLGSLAYDWTLDGIAADAATGSLRVRVADAFTFRHGETDPADPADTPWLPQEARVALNVSGVPLLSVLRLVDGPEGDEAAGRDGSIVPAITAVMAQAGARFSVEHLTYRSYDYNFDLAATLEAAGGSWLGVAGEVRLDLYEIDRLIEALRSMPDGPLIAATAAAFATYGHDTESLDGLPGLRFDIVAGPDGTVRLNGSDLSTLLR